jgi:hypothetical protein
MQFRVLQFLQVVSLVEHLSHALPLAWQSLCPAHLIDRLALCRAFFSRTVLFALTSRVTVEGLTPILLATRLAESPRRTPSSMTSLFSLLMCFPVVFGMLASFLPGKAVQGAF